MNCITEKKEISIDYYKIDRTFVKHRLLPVSVMFTDYYSYLIAFKADDIHKSLYFRVDRINHIIEHRKNEIQAIPEFDEDMLRKHNLFMKPEKLRTIRFEFSEPSVQAVLGKLSTAKIIELLGDGKYLIEAKTYGDGIKMWLLS